MSKKGKDKPQGQPQDVIGGGIDNRGRATYCTRKASVFNKKGQ